MRTVLVLDANQRSALAIIRSLGQHDVKVVAADHVANALGTASKYSAASAVYPDPAISRALFVREIIAISRRFGADTIIPATDLTTMVLVSQPELSQIADIAAPAATSYETLTDKARLLTLARELQIITPETQIAHTRTEIEDAVRDFDYPIVLKPARSRYFKGDRVVLTSVEIVLDPGQLLTKLDHLRWLDDIPCLVQRFVPGRGAGIFALYASAKPVAWFAHRRIREKPPTGGVSVVCESVPIDRPMQSAAAKLLSAAEWSGVAMVEFRVADDGSPYLMEVNGRFWGSLQLSIDCGVDFPWLLYQLSRKQSLPAPQPYMVGKRLRWLLGDFDSLLIQLRRGSSTTGNKARAITSFLGSFADIHCRQEILRLDDLRPCILESLQWVHGLFHQDV